LGLPTRGPGYAVLGFADVDASSVRITDLECFGKHG